MARRTKTIKAVASVMLGSAFLLAPHAAFGADDPAHHSTNVSDTDPAHHQPYVLCSASTSTCVLVPVAGFTLAGYAVGTTQPVDPDPAHNSTDMSDPDPAHHAGVPVVNPVPVASYDNDPAHHSTDVNDTDPAHHQPTMVNGKLTPIPGFDLYGYRVTDAAPVYAF